MSKTVDAKPLLAKLMDVPWVVVGQSEGYVRLTNVTDGGRTFLRINVVRAAPYNFYPQILVRVPFEVRKGANLRVSLKARSADNLFVDSVFEQAQAPYERCFTRRAVLSGEWQTYTGVFRSADDLPEGWGNFALHLPRVPGQIDVAELYFDDLADETPSLPDQNRFANPYGGKDLPSDWWHEAQSRIDKLRKRALEITVVSRDGTPQPGATVSITQVEQAFNFGTCVSPEFIFEKRANGKTYRQKLLQLFNCATPENSLKWTADLWEKPGTAESVVDWCLAHKLAVRGHYLFSPFFAALPDELRVLKGDALNLAIKEHIESYVSKYADKVYVWDVINEALTRHEITDLLGERLLVDAFKWARERNPRVALAYNDYQILDNAGGSNDDRRATTAKLIQRLIENGAPIGLLGIQSHMHLPLPRGNEIWRLLDEWGRFKLPIEITEFDLADKDEEQQAQYLREFLTAVFSHPAVKSFVMWGFWEGSFNAIQDGNALYRADWTPRPAAAVYEELVLKNWRTNVELVADQQGKIKLRAFMGKLNLAGKSKKQSGQAMINLDASNLGALAVTLCLK